MHAPVDLCDVAPDFWASPDVVDPEHFRPALRDARHPMAYPPFGTGQRVCIGNHFALLELKTAIAVICQRLDVDWLAPAGREASVTLKPAGPVMVRVASRRVGSSDTSTSAAGTADRPARR